MTALLAFFTGSGGAIAAVVAAVVAAIVAAFAALHSATKAGVAQQQVADLNEGVRQRALADAAKSQVAALGDTAAVDALRAGYTRKP